MFLWRNKQNENKSLATKLPRHCTHFWYAFLTLITKLAKFSRNVTIYLEDIWEKDGLYINQGL